MLQCNLQYDKAKTNKPINQSKRLKGITMLKKITLAFYAACLPDYFGGHHRPVLQVPVDGNTTRQELYNGLLSELAQGVIDYEIDNNQLDHDDIRQAIKDCIFWNDTCNDADIVFPKLDIWKDSDDNCDSCYAFFIVDWEVSEND